MFLSALVAIPWNPLEGRAARIRRPIMSKKNAETENRYKGQGRQETCARAPGGGIAPDREAADSPLTTTGGRTRFRRPNPSGRHPTPTLLEDFVLRGKDHRFDHERIPRAHRPRAGHGCSTILRVHILAQESTRRPSGFSTKWARTPTSPAYFAGGAVSVDTPPAWRKFRGQVL